MICKENSLWKLLYSREFFIRNENELPKDIVDWKELFWGITYINFIFLKKNLYNKLKLLSLFLILFIQKLLSRLIL